MQQWAIATPYGPAIVRGNTRAEAIQDAVDTYEIDPSEITLILPWSGKREGQ